jgi:hypothetical protein
LIEISTIKQLDEWMTTNCYRDDAYAIGDRNIYEGCGLDTFGSLYVWYYTERGKRENLKYFRTEKEAVEYALKEIIGDKFANAHLVGFVKCKAKEDELLTELEKRRISYWKDEIPYGGLNGPRTRVFVTGCHIRKVLDLKGRYGK